MNLNGPSFGGTNFEYHKWHRNG